MKYFEDYDPWQSNRVFHTAPSASAKVNRYTQYLGDTEMTGVSMQIELAATSENVFDETKYWVDASAMAGRPWVCANDEQGPGNLGIRASEDGTRKYTLWGNIMAGGAGVEYYVGGKDLSMEDYRTELDAVLDDADITINGFFYRQAIPFWAMHNQDALLSNSTAAHCLSDDANTFVIYLSEGGSVDLDLTALSGSFAIQWFDPRNGGNLQNGSVTSVQGGSIVNLGTAPSDPTEDWAILVKRNDTVSYSPRWQESEGYILMEMENTASPLGSWNFRDKNNLPTPPTGQGDYVTGAQGTGHLEYIGPWAAAGSPLEYTFTVSKAGIYYLQLRCFKRLDDGDPGDKHNDCFIKMAGDYESGNEVPLSALQSNTKMYGGNADSWGRASNLDYAGSHYQAAYVFKAGETYTLTITDRSTQFNIDRILLYHDDNGWPSNSQLTNLPESTITTAPVVNAGPDREITLPISDVSLYGSAADNGSITAYSWSLVSGPSAALTTGSDSPNLTASLLITGSYLFRLTVTDNEGYTSSDDVTVNVVNDDSETISYTIIEFATPFSDGELDGQHNWNAEANWTVEATNNGSVSTGTDSNIAVLNRPVTLKVGQTVSFIVDFEFDGAYSLPVGHVYTMLAGLKADDTATSLSTGSAEPDVNVQLLTTDGNYRILNNYGTIQGASSIGNSPNAGEQLRLTYELTLGSDAANTAYTVRLQNLNDGTDTGTGTVTGILSDVYDALTGSGAYMFFQRINPDANSSGLTDLQVNTFSYLAPDPILNTEIEFIAPFLNGALDGQEGWQSSSTWTVDNTSTGHASSAANSNIAVLNYPITLNEGETFAYTVDFAFTGTFAAPTNHVYTFLSGLKADNTPNAVATGADTPDANIQLLSGGSDYRLLNNYTTITGVSNLTAGPNEGEHLRFYYEITLGASAATSSYSVRLQNLSDGTDSGTGLVTELPSDVYTALTGSGAYLFVQQINPSAHTSGLTGIKVDTITLHQAFTLTGFAKFESDHALIGGLLGDDDKDGILNLFEFAFGGNPQTADAIPIKPRILLPQAGDGSILDFEFRRRKDAFNGLTYTIETSPDMINWDNYTGLALVEDESNEIELITISLPTNSADKLFVRLEVDAL